MLDDVKEVVDFCRNVSKAPLILGGAGFSIFPQPVLDYLDADMGIQGEGEAVFPLLLEKIHQNADPAGLPGLHLRGRRVQGRRSYIGNLDQYHSSWIPDFWALYDRDLWIPYQTRRGCPMNCSYCSTATIEGTFVRKRSCEKVVSELQDLVSAGFKQFYFVDNTFNLPVTYAGELCRQIIRCKMDISWRCIFYPGQVDDDLIKAMADAGCKEVSLGFESGSPKILKNMNKHFSPEDVRKTSLQLARCGIRQMGFLLLGGPGETRDSVLESLSFADTLPLDTLKVSQGIRIYPSTTLATTAVSEQRISRNDHLLTPTFYMVREIEDWLKDTVRNRMADRPHWIS